jgi:catechol 2,3-dioxygenase
MSGPDLIGDLEMSGIPFAATTPVSISRVGLKARDGERLAEFYSNLLDLKELRRSGKTIALGTDERELLEIEGDPSLEADDPRSAGLFHTAFLFPERRDLARWVRRSVDKRIGIEGASDHLVSEALYLTDPEGNGIEIYVDRAPESWKFHDGSIEMATLRLNMDSLLSELKPDDAGWTGVPKDTVIGHVHLRVGDPKEAERWWKDNMDFNTMTQYGDAAVFLSTGGYHHHIGANSWQSRGAGQRDPKRSGLGYVELASKNAAAASETVDPWGTAIRTVPAKP